MLKEISFGFKRKRRVLLTLLLEMRRGGYSLIELERTLRLIREKNLKSQQILEFMESHELKKLEVLEPVVRGEMTILLDDGYGHARTKNEHASLDRAGNPVPWYTYAAIEFAKQLDFSEKRIFEFGSGYSTLFWGGRAKAVVAVEHEKEWYERMLLKIPANVDYRYVAEPERYPRVILEYEGFFDVVVIDGELRPDCVGPALEKLSPDGLIIVDNTDWFPGICFMLRAADLIQVDMQGPAPINPYASTTSYFFRRSARFFPVAARQPMHGPGSIPNMCDSPVDPSVEKPALNDLDEKLAKYLDFEGGFFVEAGANDGYHESNTYYLENTRGWRGLLIEAIPNLAEICRKVRARSVTIQAALVADQEANSQVTMRFANLMSLVEGSLGEQELTEEHVRKELEIQRIPNSYSVEVTGRTLSSLLDEYAPEQEIDFFSLDVEGFEEQVIKGLDLTRHAPRLILVDTCKLDDILFLLESRYDLVEKLSVHDYLFRRKDTSL